jgi:Prophage CP4-57 regulatory protein (AlpA)
MAKHVPPGVTTAAGYVESEVSRYIHARIRGERWTPGPIPEHPRIIRKREAQVRTGLSNFSLWTLEQRGEFPPRVRLTEAATGPNMKVAEPEDASAGTKTPVRLQRRPRASTAAE